MCQDKIEKGSRRSIPPMAGQKVQLFHGVGIGIGIVSPLSIAEMLIGSFSM
jgi:hypothetical protein